MMKNLIIIISILMLSGCSYTGHTKVTAMAKDVKALPRGSTAEPKVMLERWMDYSFLKWGCK